MGSLLIKYYKVKERERKHTRLSLDFLLLVLLDDEGINKAQVISLCYEQIYLNKQALFRGLNLCLKHKATDEESLFH